MTHIHTNKTVQTENVSNGEVFKKVYFWTKTDMSVQTSAMTDF